MLVKRSKREIVDLFLEYQKTDKYFNPLELKELLGYKDSARIYKALKHHGITYHEHDQNKLQHTSYDRDVLYGNLLGDGFIYYSTKYANFPVFSVEYKHYEYIKYITQVNPFLDNKPIHQRQRFDERFKDGDYVIYKCVGLSSSVLKTEYTRWYSNEGRLVPRDLVLTPLLMLVWYLDNGFRQSKTGTLCTDRFSLEDNEFLAQSLKSKYNIDTTFQKASSKGNVRLYIKTSSFKNFLEIIGPCPVSCYQYKWT